MKVQLVLTIVTVLSSALCHGIPTEDHTGGRNTPPGKAYQDATESSNADQIQQDDNTLVDPESGNTEETHHDEYDTALPRATGNIRRDTENDFTATYDGAIPDYESLVALVWKQAEEYDALKEDYDNRLQILQGEMKHLLHNQRRISSADDDSAVTVSTNKSEEEFGSDWIGSSQASSGGFYIRWGRDDCPSSASKVYTGLAAGSARYHTGGGSNYLCLPNEPVYLRPTGREDDDRAQLFGVDYEISDFPPLGHLDEHDAPCAVCEPLGRSNTLMIPARNDCPNGWLREYYGYLMASHHTQQRTEFVCVDYYAGTRPGTIGEGNGSDFFPVEGRCTDGGGLPCGLYVSGYELSCAVCSK